MGKVRKTQMRITDAKITAMQIYSQYLNPKKFSIFMTVEMELLNENDEIEIITPIDIDFGNLEKKKRR